MKLLFGILKLRTNQENKNLAYIFYILPMTILITNCKPPSISSGGLVEVEAQQSVPGKKTNPSNILNPNNKITPSATATNPGTSILPTPTYSVPASTSTPSPIPTAVSDNGTANGSGEAPGCTSAPGTICEGGYESDFFPIKLPVKIIYGNPVGAGNLVANPLQYARDLIKELNKNYGYKGHQHINLVLDESKLLVVDQKSDAQMVAQYAEPGYFNFFIVLSIPGNTVGYVNFLNAKLAANPVQSYAIFEIGYIPNGVIQHEMNHLIGVPHTNSENLNSKNFFLTGYNFLKDILAPLGAYKQPYKQPFKIYVDPGNNPNTQSTHDGMVFATRNIMFANVLSPIPKLFTDDGIGYPYSYSRIFDHYYWEEIKKYAKK